MKDTKNSESRAEAKTFLEKLETATPSQAAQSVIAQILLKLKQDKKS